MKIERFQIRCVRVPMSPHKTALGTITDSPLVLLSVHTDTGVAGHSITFTYTPAALGPTADFMRNLEQLVTGRELAPAAMADTLAARFRLLGTQGIVGMALAGIDMALWDALARVTSLPLCRLLGSEPRPVRAYGAIGYDGVAGSARAAEEWARRGVRGVKAKVGYPTLEEDLAVVRAIRQAVGPDLAVMVDYNQSLTAAEARIRLRALDEEGLSWIEEPVLAHDYKAFVGLSRDTKTPLQCGENFWGPLDFQHAIDAGVRPLLMPDVMKAGGVTGWMRIAGMATASGLSVSNHLWPEISAHLLMATPTADWLEYADWWNPVLTTPLVLQDGCGVVDTCTAGAGIEFDDVAVAKYAA